jgi:hypothetical protein
MSSQRSTRRSTSALLYDENEKTIDAILVNQPLLGYTDLSSSGQQETCNSRIYARYGLFRFIY